MFKLFPVYPWTQFSGSNPEHSHIYSMQTNRAPYQVLGANDQEWFLSSCHYRTQLPLFGVALWLVPEHSYGFFLPTFLPSTGSSVVSSKKIPLWSRASIFPDEHLAPGRRPEHPSPCSCLTWMRPIHESHFQCCCDCIKYDMVFSSKHSFCSSKLHKFCPWLLRLWQIDMWDGYSVSTMKSEFA